MNRIYCVIGRLVEVTQIIEKTLVEIIEKSEIIKEFGRHNGILTPEEYREILDDVDYLKTKMETMTFGQMISIVYESESLEREEITELKALLEKRNYFTHEYFKYTDFKKNTGEKFIVEEFEAIKEYLKKLLSMQSRLDIINSNHNERIKYFRSKSNL